MAFANPTGACPGRIGVSAFKLGNFQSALLGSIHPALTAASHPMEVWRSTQICRVRNLMVIFSPVICGWAN